MPLPRTPFATFAVVGCLAAATAANATLITFDELPWRPIESFWEYPVDNQYAAQGVTFDLAFLTRDSSSGPPSNQYLLGAIDFNVYFSGTLPTHVSFNMSSPYGESSESYVTAFGANRDVLGRGRTGGYYPDGSQDPPWRQDLPYVANRQISFYSPTGIASLSFGDAYGSRFSATIDNLYFGQVAAVPEPATIALWATGLGVLAWGRRRRRVE